jgi:ankyrin repeat protein
MTQTPQTIADVDLRLSASRTEQHIIAELEGFIAQGADVSGPNGRGESALHRVCRKGLFAAAQLLIQHGADIEARGINGRTPFLEACSSLNIGLIRYLLDKGADPLAKGVNGEDALHQYLRCNEYEPTQQPDFAARDIEGMQLLTDCLKRAPTYLEECQIYRARQHLADFAPAVAEALAYDRDVKSGDVAAVTAWLDAGKPLDPNVKYGAGTLLNHAASMNDVPLIDFLLARGADINSPQNNTPLQIAAMWGARDAFRRLLEYGADTTVRYCWDVPGDTDILGLAKKGKDKEMPAFVAKAMAAQAAFDAVKRDTMTVKTIVVDRPLRLKSAPKGAL